LTESRERGAALVVLFELFLERVGDLADRAAGERPLDRKSTRLNSSHSQISYAVFCLKKKNKHFMNFRAGERLAAGSRLQLLRENRDHDNLHSLVILVFTCEPADRVADRAERLSGQCE